MGKEGFCARTMTQRDGVSLSCKAFSAKRLSHIMQHLALRTGLDDLAGAPVFKTLHSPFVRTVALGLNMEDRC